MAPEVAPLSPSPSSLGSPPTPQPLSFLWSNILIQSQLGSRPCGRLWGWTHTVLAYIPAGETYSQQTLRKFTVRRWR